MAYIDSPHVMPPPPPTSCGVRPKSVPRNRRRTRANTQTNARRVHSSRRHNQCSCNFAIQYANLRNELKEYQDKMRDVYRDAAQRIVDLEETQAILLHRRDELKKKVRFLKTELLNLNNLNFEQSLKIDEQAHYIKHLEDFLPSETPRLPDQPGYDSEPIATRGLIDNPVRSPLSEESEESHESDGSDGGFEYVHRTASERRLSSAPAPRVSSVRQMRPTQSEDVSVRRQISPPSHLFPGGVEDMEAFLGRLPLDSNHSYQPTVTREPSLRLFDESQWHSADKITITLNLTHTDSIETVTINSNFPIERLRHEVAVFLETKAEYIELFCTNHGEHVNLTSMKNIEKTFRDLHILNNSTVEVHLRLKLPQHFESESLLDYGQYSNPHGKHGEPSASSTPEVLLTELNELRLAKAHRDQELETYKSELVNMLVEATSTQNDDSSDMVKILMKSSMADVVNYARDVLQGQKQLIEDAAANAHPKKQYRMSQSAPVTPEPTKHYPRRIARDESRTVVVREESRSAAVRDQARSAVVRDVSLTEIDHTPRYQDRTGFFSLPANSTVLDRERTRERLERSVIDVSVEEDDEHEFTHSLSISPTHSFADKSMSSHRSRYV